jgi:RNA polymerase sigma factor FliA
MDSIKPLGTPAGLEQVLIDQLPQVRSIARGIHHHLPPQVPLEDLIQAGILGLMDAFHKFNPGKHVQLMSYARIRIRGAIIDSLREMDWGPRYLRRQSRRIEAARQTLNKRLGRELREEDIAAELNMSLKTFQRLHGEIRGLALFSLDQLKSSGIETGKKSDKYAPTASDLDPFSLCFRGEIQSFILSALDDFDKRKRQVLTLYYLEEFTMKEVGRELGIGESRVSQIHSEALVGLREKLGKILDSRNRIANETDCLNSAPKELL